MTLQEICQTTGLNKNTVLAWEKAGRIQLIRTPGNHRRYESTSVHYLIKQAHGLGLPPIQYKYFKKIPISLQEFETLWRFYVDKPHPPINPATQFVYGKVFMPNTPDAKVLKPVYDKLNNHLGKSLVSKGIQ